MRQRANGTVLFIGELFKIDMLLQESTEEKIERVFKLLTTIEEIDRRKALENNFQ